METVEHAKLITESKRYLHNAKEILKKAGRENGYYIDEKYVSSACDVAYKGALVATDAYLEKYGKRVPEKKGRRHADNYRELLGKINRKALNSFNTAYYELHINGYYQGVLKAKSIHSGFEALEELIDAAKN